MKKLVTVLLVCTTLRVAAFAQNESDFKTDGKGTITGYDGWDTVIVIPAQIGAISITAIGNGAFKNMGITGVTFPAGITRIGDEAFATNKLASVAIADGASVGKSAFSSNLLTSITVGKGVTINEQAFSGNKLASVAIADGTTVGKSAFSSNQLTSLTVGDRVTIHE
ncbi:MAG: leucine-rich repeat domain-containing protein [Treponema sp.]|jgi:hypothetical protein|nr:leucine-rich repeat domain-containing protein [Treponema sp.]